jgi:hypothetical protein
VAQRADQRVTGMARLFGLLMLLTLVSFALAQDSTAPPADDAAVAQGAAAEGAESTASAEAAAAEAAASDPDFINDDPTLDEQTYEEDEDVFVPTEEIPSDEPIPFPTNI